MRLDTPLQVILVTPQEGHFGPLDEVLQKTYLPNRAIARLSAKGLKAQEKDIPLLTGKVPQGGTTTAYVCEEGRCEQPTSDPKVLARQLAKHQPLFRDRTPPALLINGGR